MMSFALTDMAASEGNLGAALRDYALDQLAQADLQLARVGAWQHEGVHLARKAFARLRACVELLHKSPQAALALERRLRSFAHALSPLRDAQAALSTTKYLSRNDQKLSETWRSLAHDLRQRRDRVLGTALASDPGFATHRAEVVQMRGTLATMAWERVRAGDVQRALKRAHKRVRRAQVPAMQSTGQEPRHRLRRRSRRLLLQVELLRGIARDESRPSAAAAAHDSLREVLGKALARKQRKRVIDDLGWEQDLRVLRRALPARATVTSMRRVFSALRRELDDAIAASNDLLT
jgi:hypothetical protein